MTDKAPVPPALTQQPVAWRARRLSDKKLNATFSSESVALDKATLTKRGYDESEIQPLFTEPRSAAPVADTGETMQEVGVTGVAGEFRLGQTESRAAKARSASAPPSAEAIRIANETLAEPDARARVKVQLVALCGQATADMVDEMVVMAREILRLAAPLTETLPQCNHQWVSADNKIVSGVEVCLKCRMIRAARAEGAPPK